MTDLIPSQRDAFDLPRDAVWMNAAQMSALHRSVREAGEAGVRRKGRPWEGPPISFFAEIEEARGLMAGLIGATAEDLAVCPSASYAIATAARNLPVERGQSIVVFEGQFPSNVYSWRRAATEAGAEIVTGAPSRGGQLRRDTAPELTTFLPPLDDLRDQVGHRGPLLRRRVHARRPREELGEHRRHHLRLRRECRRDEVDESAQLVSRRAPRLVQRRPELLGDALVELVEQCRLAREVQEERATPDVGLLADVRERGRLEAAAREQTHRRLVDVPTGALLLALAARPVGAWRSRRHRGDSWHNNGLESILEF